MNPAHNISWFCFVLFPHYFLSPLHWSINKMWQQGQKKYFKKKEEHDRSEAEKKNSIFEYKEKQTKKLI